MLTEVLCDDGEELNGGSLLKSKRSINRPLNADDRTGCKPFEQRHALTNQGKTIALLNRLLQLNWMRRMSLLVELHPDLGEQFTQSLLCLGMLGRATKDV